MWVYVPVRSISAETCAQRAASGDGRVYTIEFLADDLNGGVCQGSVTVEVPHSARGGAGRGASKHDSTR